MLEEADLTYRVHRVDLGRAREGNTPYHELNPSGRIPTIVDYDGPDGGTVVLTQSMAILVYLAEKSGRLLPEEALLRMRMWEWLALDATDIATTRFDAFWMSLKCGEAVRPGVELLTERVMGFYTLMDQRLQDNRYLAGDVITIADISAYPWVVSMNHPDMSGLVHTQHWLEELGKREAVRRGMIVP